MTRRNTRAWVPRPVSVRRETGPAATATGIAIVGAGIAAVVPGTVDVTGVTAAADVTKPQSVQ